MYKLKITNEDLHIFLDWLHRKKGYGVYAIIHLISKIHHTTYQDLYNEYMNLSVEEIFD